MHLLEKLWILQEKIEISNLPQQKDKNVIIIRTKLSYRKVFHRKKFSYRNEKTQIYTNKPVYLGFSILVLSKISMYEVCYDYLKLKYSEEKLVSLQIFKKETPKQVFFCQYFESIKNIYFKGHLWTTGSEFYCT